MFGKAGLQQFEGFSRGKGWQVQDSLGRPEILRCVVEFPSLLSFLWFSFQLVFKERLPIRSVFDRFKPHRGSARRQLKLDRKAALSRRRVIGKQTGDVQPLQTITGQTRFASDLGPDAGNLFAMAREAPAFNQNNFAACRPALRQIERKRQIGGDVFPGAFAISRALEQLPNWFDDFPRPGALDLLQQLLAALQLGGGVRAPRFWSRASRCARWSRD